ncbi:alanyl-tRNA editing protein [Crenobacter cavernae]|uniref:Alanyl-tRNA editing protein n=1 Tax=Crenobacter cavernae TaxID=2290923 RepID=A0A345Y3H4_9NEIS|nr:alanyl-tRNA editing protein [Crenobacter cavernae]AXK38476.1 alanyl-tRNA editing protein [Crenobacter cavernae]
MTDKVFWADPYLTTLNTRVAHVAGLDVTLAATVFFAESGGQESDTGSIAGHRVLAARWQGRDIVYTLPPDHGLWPGDVVTVKIDWPRRYKLMRLHFAAEIVLELVTRRLAGVGKVGAHIAEDKARIDFVWHEPLTPMLAELTREAQALIDADAPIVSAFSDEANERRYWEVAGFARVPCGGTHLKTTGEVGVLRLRRKNVGGGKERIEIYVDERG